MPQIGSFAIFAVLPVRSIFECCNFSLRILCIDSTVRDVSAKVRVDGFQQLIEHCFGFGFLSATQRFGGAVMQVIAHEISCDASQSFLHAGDLGDDVGAVAIFFDHFLQAANLAFDAAQTLEVSGFQLRIDADGFAGFGADGAGAVGGRDVLESGVGGNLGRHAYPLGLYIPLGAIGCQIML
jgi:hypothetical protein